MHDNTYLTYIELDPGILCGKPVIKGTRLSVEFIVEMVEDGMSFEEIEDAYPSLTNSKVQAALAYAKDHF